MVLSRFFLFLCVLSNGYESQHRRYVKVRRHLDACCRVLLHAVYSRGIVAGQFAGLRELSAVMPRKVNPLTALAVKTALSQPGRYRDGKGLTLRVREGYTPLWTLEYTAPDGRRRELSLGDAGDIGLSHARVMAQAQRVILRDGRDPLEERRAKREAAIRDRINTPTFGECAERCIEVMSAGWRNKKHHKQWSATLSTYCESFYSLPVADVGLPHVLAAIEPIWTTKTETANRVRQRIETVLDWAKARTYRSGENPARLRGYLDSLLPKSSKKKRVKKRAAIPYRALHAFLVTLRQRHGLAARVLELQILTAVRPGEAAGAQWDEFDICEGVWTIPGDRMKAEVEHRVPLSAPVTRLLAELPRVHARLLFPGAGRGKPVKPISTDAAMELMHDLAPGMTAHGFRSSFRDWAADQTAFPREVAEAALSHQLQGVEAAYRRTDFFDKRADLMEAWANFCNTPPASGNVTAIKREAKA